MMSQHHVVSNHQQLACLLNSLFRLTAPSNHHLCITGPLWEECQHWLVVSLHKGQLCKNFPVSSHQHLIQGFSQEGPVMMKVFLCHAIILFHHFLAATKQLYEWYFLSVCPSVRLSVCPSVRLSHLFDNVPIIVSSWNFQELSHWTKVRSMQKVKVRGQRSRSQRSRLNFSFPDCNSSLNSYMMMKLYI